MIGKLSYDEMLKLADQLNKSSDIIKSYIKDEESSNNIRKFCEEIDTYTRFLISSVQLYKYSDEALKTMIEKNK